MKLILINGPTGIGKSTIAQKIHQDLPLSFLLDIDAQRRYISGYREHRAESLDLVIKLSLATVENYLQSKHDVVIDKVITDVEMAEKFFELGRKYNATVFEFVLNTDKETLVARAGERGYKEGGMLTLEKVPKFWDRIQNYIKERPRAIVVETKNLNPDRDMWSYPKGHIETGETVEQATRREVFEETGYEINIIRQLSDIVYTKEGTNESIRISMFLSTAAKRISDGEEGIIKEWFTIAEAEEKLFPYLTFMLKEI